MKLFLSLLMLVLVATTGMSVTIPEDTLDIEKVSKIESSDLEVVKILDIEYSKAFEVKHEYPTVTVNVPDVILLYKPVNLYLDPGLITMLEFKSKTYTKSLIAYIYNPRVVLHINPGWKLSLA